MAALKRVAGLIFQVVFLFIITACGTTGYGAPAGASYSGGGAEQGEQGGNSEQIDIPPSPRVRPAEVLDQVIFGGTGGEEGIGCPCLYVEGTTLYLEGLSANQTVRLVAYDEYEQDFGSYYADWNVSVDSSGNLALAINGDISRYRFVAFDPATGEQVAPLNVRVYASDGPPEESHLLAQISSEVEGVNMRSSPGYSYKDESVDVLAILASGDMVEVLDGPTTADGLDWWQVSWKGYTGWVAATTKNGRTILVFDP